LAGLDYRIVRFCIFNIIWRGVWTFMMIDSTEKVLDTHTVLQHMLEICIYLAPKKKYWTLRSDYTFVVNM